MSLMFGEYVFPLSFERGELKRRGSKPFIQEILEIFKIRFWNLYISSEIFLSLIAVDLQFRVS